MAEPWLPYGLRYRIASARPGRAIFHARSSFHVFLVCRAPTGPRAVVVRVIGVAGGDMELPSPFVDGVFVIEITESVVDVSSSSPISKTVNLGTNLPRQLEHVVL